MIRGNNMGAGRFLSMDDFAYVSDSKAREDLAGNLAKAGDLIFTQRGTLGQVAIVPEDGSSTRYVVSQSQMKLTVDERRANNFFLYYYFSSNQVIERIKNLASSSGVPHVNLATLRSFQVPVPPLKVQRAIAMVLSAYDDLIENNRRRIRLLERAARSIYKEWFVRLRFPGHERTSTARNVPEGWKAKHLSEIASITMGQSPKSIYYNDAGVGLPFHQGVTNFGERFPSHRTYCTVRNRLAMPGDILFSVRAPVGRINVACDKIVIGRGIAAIRSNQNQQNFLFYAMKSHFFKEDMIGGGTIFSAVAKKDLHRVELIQPEDEIVDLFSEFVVPIDRQIASLQRTIDKLCFARDKILPRLMNGEIGCP